VTSGGGDFERALDRFLAFDFGEIELVVVMIVEQRAEIHFRRRDFGLAFEKAGGLAQVMDRDHLQSADDACFRGIFRRDENAGLALRAGAERDGQDAFDGAHGAGEGQFANHDKVFELIGLDLFAGGDHADGDRQIEAWPFFLHVGGREVDRGAAEGEVIAGVDQGGRDTIARLLHCGVGKTDDNDQRIAEAALTSTSTGYASIPLTAAEQTLASMSLEINKAIDQGKGKGVVGLIVANRERF
jgi:hypothetical protein